MNRASLLPLMVASLLSATACVEPVSTRALTLAVDAGAETGPDAGGCGAISSAGCCAGTTLSYCAGGTIKSKACTSPAQCGWSAAYGLYACGASSSSDPSGKHPRTCPASDASVDAPGADSMAADVSPPAPADNGSPDQPGVSDAAPPDAPAGCGPLTFAGCCVKQKLYFCAGSKVLALDCQSNLHCGWNAKGGYYDCGTDGKADPSGKYPRSCGAALGDAGLALDVGSADLLADLTAGDSGAADAITGDGQGDLSLGDSAAVVDGPAPDQTADRGAEGVVGLDAVGLEPSRRDASTGDSEADGCSCSVRGAGSGGWSLPLLLLIGLALLRRRP